MDNSPSKPWYKREPKGSKVIGVIRDFVSISNLENFNSQFNTILVLFRI